MAIFPVVSVQRVVPHCQSLLACVGDSVNWYIPFVELDETNAYAGEKGGCRSPICTRQGKVPQYGYLTYCVQELNGLCTVHVDFGGSSLESDASKS